MSESQAKKELSGIARSIDTLFRSSSGATRGGVEGDPQETLVPPPPPEVEEQPSVEEGAAPEAAPPPLPDLDEVGPAALGMAGEAEPSASVDPIAPLPGEAGPEGFSGEEGAEKEVQEVAEDSALEEVVLEETVVEETVLEETAVEETLVEEEVLHEEVLEETAIDEAVIEEAVEEEAPSELELSVEAFLSGEAGRAGEISGLAAQLLEGREVEPVVRSMIRLVLAAGEPPESSTYELAESLMSPVVLGRFARRMGAERDEARRQEYYQVCRVIGAPMAGAIRDDLAETTDRLARRVHCEALVAMGESGWAMVEEMAVDENRFLARNAVSILGEHGGDRAVELVTFALANPDARVRREALRSLAKLGDAESGELVVGLIDDSDEDVRIAAAVTAGELGVERAVRPILALLDRVGDPEGQIPILRALGQIGDPGAVPAIEKRAVTSLFSRPRTDVRIAAYRALHDIGTPHASKLLQRALDDKDAAVRSAAKSMLAPD